MVFNFLKAVNTKKKNNSWVKRSFLVQDFLGSHEDLTIQFSYSSSFIFLQVLIFSTIAHLVHSYPLSSAEREEKVQQNRTEAFKRNNTKEEPTISTSKTNGSTSKSSDCHSGSAVESKVSYLMASRRRRATHPCVKKIVKTYHASLDSIVAEYECWQASFYCPQTLSGLGRCQPIKSFHAGLGRIVTTGCECKP